MDKFVHTLMTNLSPKIQISCNEKVENTNYSSHTEKTREKKKDAATMHETSSFSDVRDMQHSLASRTPVFVNPSFRVLSPLMSHLRKINKPLVQKIPKSKSSRGHKRDFDLNEFSVSRDDCLKDENATSQKTDGESSATCNSWKTRNPRENNRNAIVAETREKCPKNQSTAKSLKTSCSQGLWWIQRKKRNSNACNLAANVTQYTKEKIQRDEMYLSLHLKNEHFLRENVHVTLYISRKMDIPANESEIRKSQSQQTLLLCKSAILSLIDPSKKAIACYSEDLITVILQHIENGFKFHYTFTSEYDNYRALLVMSHSAGLLMRYPEATAIRAISYVIGCSTREILILTFPEMENMVSEEVVESPKKPQQPVFKNSSFQQQFRPISTSGKKRTWRSLKQVLTQERSLPWPPEVVHYSYINAPPSFKPAKKYSDISGLPARYTDPQTKLYYATAEEFSTVRSLPMDITAGYLALRGASSIVG